MIKEFEEHFKKVLPGKRLLAVSLDGFSHSAWYDSGKNTDKIEQLWYSGCAPENPHNTLLSKALLGMYSHVYYQNDPFYHVWVRKEDR